MAEVGKDVGRMQLDKSPLISESRTRVEGPEFLRG